MRRVRLRTLLLLINLLILILPLAGLWFLRLYESALIRQTESELVAQAAVLVGTFKADRRLLLAEGRASPEAPDETPRITHPAVELSQKQGLDLAVDSVLPPPPAPAPPSRPALPLARLIGEHLGPVIHDAQQVTLASIRVLDAAGVIVATTGGDLGQSLAGLSEVQLALQGEPVSVMRLRERPARIVPGGISRGADLRVFVTMPVVEGDRVLGAVMLSRTPRDLAQAMWGKRYELSILVAVLIVAGGGLAIVASRLITRPLGVVVDQARRVAAGQLDAIAPITGAGTREAAELSTAVARMAETLAKRADYIRSFAAHVSHEFKTPLASAKGAVELLGDHGETMTAEERAHFLDVVAVGLDRLDRLVQRLVDLARAEMTERGGGSVTVLPVLEIVAERYRARGLPVSLRGDDAIAALPREALEIMIATLLDNTLQHAGKSAAATIETSASADSVLITVADNGCGISPDNRRSVFEPFFTTARAQGGTGLGLSIVHAIASAAGGSIKLLAPKQGAAFLVSLPFSK
jgi:signal transduction histidine kinase